MLTPTMVVLGSHLMLNKIQILVNFENIKMFYFQLRKCSVKRQLSGYTNTEFQLRKQFQQERLLNSKFLE